MSTRTRFSSELTPLLVRGQLLVRLVTGPTHPNRTPTQRAAAQSNRRAINPPTALDWSLIRLAGSGAEPRSLKQEPNTPTRPPTDTEPAPPTQQAPPPATGPRARAPHRSGSRARGAARRSRS